MRRRCAQVGASFVVALAMTIVPASPGMTALSPFHVVQLNVAGTFTGAITWAADTFQPTMITAQEVCGPEYLELRDYLEARGWIMRSYETVASSSGAEGAVCPEGISIRNAAGSRGSTTNAYYFRYPNEIQDPSDVDNSDVHERNYRRRGVPSLVLLGVEGMADLLDSHGGSSF